MIENFEPKKMRVYVKVAMAIFALLLIGINYGLLYFFTTALKKEAEEEKREVRHVIPLNDDIPSLFK